MNDDDREATTTVDRPSPRYVRPDSDHSCCLKCWSSARVRSARESAARLATRQAIGQVMGGVLIAFAVLVVGMAAMVVIAGAWLDIGRAVMAGGGGR